MRILFRISIILFLISLTPVLTLAFHSPLTRETVIAAKPYHSSEHSTSLAFSNYYSKIKISLSAGNFSLVLNVTNFSVQYNTTTTVLYENITHQDVEKPIKPLVVALPLKGILHINIRVLWNLDMVNMIISEKGDYIPVKFVSLPLFLSSIGIVLVVLIKETILPYIINKKL